ncbi:MAG: shikimate kinase [Acidimicrobiales bacterium]
MARLVLVGLPGVGKTTVARLLAVQWRCESIDTDDLLSDAVGCPAPEYLRREGVAAFRQAELTALREALRGDVVVATGGGVVTTPEARTILLNEVTLWLDCDDATLVPRLGGVERPLLGEDPMASLRRLRSEREAWYQEVARARVDASGDERDVAARVADALMEVTR